MDPYVLVNFGFGEHTGRSTMNAIFAFLLGRMKERTLLIDLDPSMIATNILAKTHKFEVNPEQTVYSGLNGNNQMKDNVVRLNESLSFIPGDWRISLWNPKLSNNVDEDNILSALIDEFSNKYKYIIVDMPHIQSPILNNGLKMATNVFLTLENHKSSYKTFTKDIQYLTEYKVQSNSKFDVSGVVLYFNRGNPSSKDNQLFLNDARAKFRDAILSNPLWYQERIKNFTEQGISSNGIWDGRVLNMYQNLLNEELTRIEG